MIPFFTIEPPADAAPGSLTPERRLARRMGTPPNGSRSLDPGLDAACLKAKCRRGWIGLIFEPHFWYGEPYWRQWTEALLNEDRTDTISIPAGNQEPAWAAELKVPLYLTLRGLELAAGRDVAAQRWMIRPARDATWFSVVAVPEAVIDELPGDLRIADLPGHWTQNRTRVNIFCHGWMHSFATDPAAARREDLLSMCSWQGEVLEIGCAAGTMAAACKSLGNPVRWTGIDIDHAGLRTARTVMDAAVEADVTCGLPIRPEIRFDRIVCGDVLEHLPYPWRFLSDLRAHAANGARLICAVPNVGHWSVVADLLAGRWDETPSGLLCVSHLRFGTRKSWQRWFEQNGWKILRVETETVSLPAGSPLAGMIASLEEVDPESLETFRYRILAEARV